MTVTVSDWIGRSLAMSCILQARIHFKLLVAYKNMIMMMIYHLSHLGRTMTPAMEPAVRGRSLLGTRKNYWCKRLWNAYVVRRCWEERTSS